MYNILEFKALFSTEPSDSNYFHEVKDEIERYKKQIDHITLTIINNYKLISDFFDDHDFHSNYIEFEKYRKKQYPQYYKTN
ncbi:MAG: hypothetical protein H6551_07730 [Chitinophagales bacterium]|nr:hypothetical protein [Chitinophagaceae bacterium]MCB9065015.1 hypothetical protein [Chitinophagales bacterium]